MPEEQHTSDRRRRRRGRGRGPAQRGPGPQSQQSSSSKQAQPSGLSRFLSVITFGLLGSKKPAPRPRPAKAPPVRFEGEGNSRPPRGDREARPPRDREARPPREPRPAPTPAEVTNERLYVGNLSYDATESDLFELFNGVGSVRNAEVVVNNRTQRSKGFAFITMATIDEAKRAVAELNGKDFMGRSLQVSGAKPPQHDRDGGEGSAPVQAEEQAAA